MVLKQDVCEEQVYTADERRWRETSVNTNERDWLSLEQRFNSEFDCVCWFPVTFVSTWNLKNDLRHFGKNVHVDTPMNWLEFGAQSHCGCERVICLTLLERLFKPGTDAEVWVVKGKGQDSCDAHLLPQLLLFINVCSSLLPLFSLFLHS